MPLSWAVNCEMTDKRHRQGMLNCDIRLKIVHRVLIRVTFKAMYEILDDQGKMIDCKSRFVMRYVLKQFVDAKGKTAYTSVGKSSRDMSTDDWQ